jgi:excisionase family DNA binding protein
MADFRPRAELSGTFPASQRIATPEALEELLTVEEVAAWLKVSKTWVYEHTRARGTSRAERLPFLKIGKYTRFDPEAVREFLLRRCHVR